MASDPDEGDNGRVQYAILGKLSNMFQITEHGVISLAHSIDVEHDVVLSFSVYAVDMGSPALVGSARVTVHNGAISPSTQVCQYASYTKYTF